MPSIELDGFVHSCGFRLPKDCLSPSATSGVTDAILGASYSLLRHKKGTRSNFKQVFDSMGEGDSFPSSELVPTGMTLETMLERIF